MNLGIGVTVTIGELPLAKMENPHFGHPSVFESWPSGFSALESEALILNSSSILREHTSRFFLLRHGLEIQKFDLGNC